MKCGRLTGDSLGLDLWPLPKQCQECGWFMDISGLFLQHSSHCCFETVCKWRQSGVLPLPERLCGYWQLCYCCKTGSISSRLLGQVCLFPPGWLWTSLPHPVYLIWWHPCVVANTLTAWPVIPGTNLKLPTPWGDLCSSSLATRNLPSKEQEGCHLAVLFCFFKPTWLGYFFDGFSLNAILLHQTIWKCNRPTAD